MKWAHDSTRYRYSDAKLGFLGFHVVCLKQIPKNDETLSFIRRPSVSLYLVPLHPYSIFILSLCCICFLIKFHLIPRHELQSHTGRWRVDTTFRISFIKKSNSCPMTSRYLDTIVLKLWIAYRRVRWDFSYQILKISWMTSERIWYESRFLID